MRTKLKSVILSMVLLITLTACQNSDGFEQYQTQIDKLNNELENQKTDYEAQLEELEAERAATEEQLISIQDEKDEMSAELNEIKDIKEETDTIAKINLFDQEKIGQASSSQTGELSVITITEGENYGTYVYMNKIGEPIRISDYVFEPIWSPNKMNVFIDEGTSSLRNALFVNENTGKVDFSLDYASAIFWINDEEVVYGLLNLEIDLEPITDLPKTVDVAVYNLVTQEERVLIEGKHEYIIVPNRLLPDGKLECIKSYISSEPLDVTEEIVVIDINR